MYSTGLINQALKAAARSRGLTIALSAGHPLTMVALELYEAGVLTREKTERGWRFRVVVS